MAQRWFRTMQYDVQGSLIARFCRKDLRSFKGSFVPTTRIIMPMTNGYYSWASREGKMQREPCLSRLHTAKSFSAEASFTKASFTVLSPKLKGRVEKTVARHEEILGALQDSSKSSSSSRLGAELSRTSPVYALYTKLMEVTRELASMEDLKADLVEGEDDDEMLTECEHEMELLESRKRAIETKLVRSVLLPVNEEDLEADAILEVRAGTGGDEASLFADELFTTYEKTARARGFSCEVLSKNVTDLGGLREATLSISSAGGGRSSYSSQSYDDDDVGDDDEDDQLGPYGYFKYESGVHRVQRVPVNDVRIHTSAASVAVLPAMATSSSSGVNELLPVSELKIETHRSSGAGGQHVNTTDSACRVTHLPTGITAAIQDHRSQHKNREAALKLVAARVRDFESQKKERERGELRSSLLGGGDRSERVRTYNYPQDRVTDHRCKITERGIDRLLRAFSAGGGTGADDTSGTKNLVDTFGPLLRRMDQEERLRMLEEEEDEEDDK